MKLITIRQRWMWVETECHECGRRNVSVVQLGEPPDYESQTADICIDCLRQALALAEKARVPADPNMNDQRVHAVVMRDVRDGKG